MAPVTLTVWEAAARMFEPREPSPETPIDLLCILDHRTRRTPAVEMVSDAVVWALNTPDARLVVVMAPQEGKSSTVTRAGALYALRQDPTRRVAITSYADRLARRWGRTIRNGITGNSGRGGFDFGLRLAPDQQAADEWELTTGGGIYTAGVGGSLTGRPVDVLFIDDPVKDRKAADSPTIRDDVWDWWESTASSRLAPGAPVILVLTRWHHDDLAGRLLRHQPGVWRVVHIPAQADPAIVDPDPLGREPGEFMLSARGRTGAQWEARKRDAGEEWTPLYQGAPAAPGGEHFDVSRLRWWTWNRDRTALVCGTRLWRVTLDMHRFITIDLAFSTKRSADWTVAAAWGIAIDGSLLLLDVVRARVPEHQQIDLARPLVEKWNPEAVYVEASSRSTQLVREAVLEGWRIRDLHADRDKVTRSAGAARRLHHGEVWFPAAADGLNADQVLLDYVKDELKQFPNARHDDFVDVFGYAALVAFEDYVPPPNSQPPRAPSAVDALSPATDVPDRFDPMRAEF